MGSLPTQSHQPLSVLRSLSLKAREAVGINMGHPPPTLPSSIIQFLQAFPHPANSPSEREWGLLQIWQVCFYLGGEDRHYHLPWLFTEAQAPFLSSRGVGLLGFLKLLLFRQNLQREHWLHPARCEQKA